MVYQREAVFLQRQVLVTSEYSVKSETSSALFARCCGAAACEEMPFEKPTQEDMTDSP